MINFGIICPHRSQFLGEFIQLRQAVITPFLPIPIKQKHLVAHSHDEEVRVARHRDHEGQGLQIWL